MSESSLPSPSVHSLSSSAISSSIALWDSTDSRGDGDRVGDRENQLTACLEIPDVAHVEKKKKGPEIGPAPQPQDRLVGI